MAQGDTRNDSNELSVVTGEPVSVLEEPAPPPTFSEIQHSLHDPYEQRGDPKLTESGQWKGLGWTGQPVLRGDYVYFGSGDSYVYCIDWFHGSLAWYYPNHHSVKGSISISDNSIYHGGRDNKIHCYDLNGRMVWETRTGNDMDSNPVIADG